MKFTLQDGVPDRLTLANDIDGWRAELDQYFATMREFRMMEPDEIFVALSGFTSRASEIRSRLVRVESRSNQAFRTREIDPFLEECDRQFKLWSRVVSVQSIEAELSGRTT